MHKGWLLALTITAAACGGGKKTEPTTPPMTKTDVAAVGVLELGEITLFDGTEVLAKLHADGKTEMFMGGSPVSGPTFKADGTIEFKGKARRVDADGKLVDPEGKPPEIHVTADKLTVSWDGKDSGLELAADGTATFFGADAIPGKKVRFEGADTPGKRRTALLLGTAMFGRAVAVEPGAAKPQK
jgi:hypothetical protein